MNEFDVIAQYLAPLAGPEGLGLLDDAAHYKPLVGFDTIITKDTMVEGVHFPKGELGALTAQRLLRVNLSDLAAKGAKPRGYLLSIAWPDHIDVGHIEDFAKGLKLDQEAFGLKLWGGDTVSIKGPAVFTATMIGICPTDMASKRSGVRPGDDIWMTGQIGKGYLGLKNLDTDEKAKHYFYLPSPRLGLRKALQTWASASLDISDGLVADLGHLASVNNVKLTIEIDNILWPSLSQKLSILKMETQKKMLTHGDDYEVVFTAHPDFREQLENAAKHLPFPVTRIGQCDFGDGVLVTQNGIPMEFEKSGYKHF